MVLLEFGYHVLCVLRSFLVQIPRKGKIYSVNEGNAKNWDVPTAKYDELGGSFLSKNYYCDFVTSQAEFYAVSDS
jgi:fructose-1,6-bisphosphatase